MDGMNDDTISWNNTITTSNVTQDWQYYPPQEYAIKIDGDISISGKISSKQWEKLEEEVKKIKEANKMAQVGLYEVYVVDKKNKVFVGKESVISDDIARAIMIATKRMDIDVENENLAMEAKMVMQWESKKPKEVKIVKD